MSSRRRSSPRTKSASSIRGKEETMKRLDSGTFVWAEIKGWPAWPARISSDGLEVHFMGENTMMELKRCSEVVPVLRREDVISKAAESRQKLLSKADRRRFDKAVEMMNRALFLEASSGESETTTTKRRSTRKRRSRIVRVGGHDVLTANLYDLESGEPSVWDEQ